MFERLETICANAVERTFATAFPSALEPVQIARKLVAAFESGAGTSGRGGRRFVVRMNPSDFAKFERDRTYLEPQWSAMLERLLERSGRPERAPEVRAESDGAIVRGTVTIAVEPLPEPTRLSMRLRKGIPLGETMPLDRRIVVGRDVACDFVVHDARVSRRHLEIEPEGALLRFRDLDSSNGTTLNGKTVGAGELGLGDVVGIGDSELVVEPGDA